MAEAGEILTDLREHDVLFGLGSSIYDWHDLFGKLFLQPSPWSGSSRPTWATCAPARALPRPARETDSKANNRNCLSQPGKTIHRRYHDPL
ncbi:hypothetical protein [Nocardia sp. Marseille-Q1738]